MTQDVLAPERRGRRTVKTDGRPRINLQDGVDVAEALVQYLGIRHRHDAREGAAHDRQKSLVHTGRLEAVEGRQ